MAILNQITPKEAINLRAPVWGSQLPSPSSRLG